MDLLQTLSPKLGQIQIISKFYRRTAFLVVRRKRPVQIEFADVEKNEWTPRCLEHQSRKGDDRRQASDHDGQDVMSNLFC